MQGLEADIRKHIRIEHQLKLHIESVEDRVEELEREQEAFQKEIKELQEHKRTNESLKKELSSKEEVLDVKQILLQK
jgi:archaellum component FlaC